MKLRKNIHRLLAIVLALNLSLSLVNVTAMAANEDAGRILVCGKVEHTHDETCYGEPEIICGLEEGAGRHIHTEECYGEVKTLICGQEENGGHVHGDECYQVTETRTLICGEEERDPVTRAQLDENGMPSADLAPVVVDPGHKHSDGCYAVETSRELICPISEGEGGHTHTDDCYKTETGLICGQEESEGHQLRDGGAYAHGWVLRRAGGQTQWRGRGYAGFYWRCGLRYPATGA